MMRCSAQNRLRNATLPTIALYAYALVEIVGFGELVVERNTTWVNMSDPQLGLLIHSN